MPKCLTINSKTINEEVIIKANDLLIKCPHKIIIITIPNIKDSKVELLNNIIDRSRTLVKIEGGYDKQRLKNDIGSKYIHKYSNLYTIDQVFLISEEINNIIKRIHKNWTKEQILVYFLNEIKTKIIYDNKYRHADEYDIRNLTGLYTTKTTCGGYAMILKELCDQVEIECMFVEGYFGQSKPKNRILNHAWNIVKLNSKYYPIDITIDIGSHGNSYSKSLDVSFNKPFFLKRYTPGTNEQITDYTLLSNLDNETINRLVKQAAISKEYTGSICILKRDDGTEFLITECDYHIINQRKVIKYIISPLDNLNPQIVYATFDLNKDMFMYEEKEELLREKNRYSKYGNSKKLESIKKKLSEYDKSISMYNLRVITTHLFSEENIKKSSQTSKGFLGTGVIDENGRICAIVDNKEIVNKLNDKTKTYTRSNGTKFVVEETNNYDSRLYSYKVYEYITYKSGYKLLENTIYTDFDILKDNNPFLPNIFLSRKRIDERCLNNNGYLGHYIKNNLFAYSKNIQDTLEKNSRISISHKKRVLVKKHN